MTDFETRASPAAHTGMAEPSARARTLEVDALRVALVFGVVLFHTVRVFDGFDFYVKAQPRVDPLGVIVLFCALWGMPLFFALAGWSLWWSLRSRPVAAVARERARRLAVPFVVGVVLLVPPQLHLEALAQGEHVSYARTLQRFFDIHLAVRFPLPVDGSLFEPAHLWFLAYLFAFTLVLLPVLAWARRATARRICAGLLPALALVVVLADAVLGTEDAGGWNRWAYPAYLVAGFATAARPALAGRLADLRRRSSLLGAVGFVPLAVSGLMLHDRLGDGLMASVAAAPVVVVRWTVPQWLQFGVIALGGLAFSALAAELLRRAGRVATLFGGTPRRASTGP